MSKPLSKKSLVRSAWITALRFQGQRQCCKWNCEPDDNSVCAMQLLWELVRPCALPRPTYERLGRLAGLSAAQTWTVITMNDGTCQRRAHTFAEIADVVEGWFK